MDPPERHPYVCPNGECDLHGAAFWDEFGSFYHTTVEGLLWAFSNSIYSADPKTHKNKGTEAIGSCQRETTMRFCKEYRFPLKQIIDMKRWSLFHCDEFAEREPTMKNRILLSLAVWVSDPSGNLLTLMIRHHPPREEDRKQSIKYFSRWLHHPYPWISNRARKVLEQIGI